MIVTGQFPALPAFVIGEEDEPAVLHALQQHHPGGWHPVRRRGGQCHGIGKVNTRKRRKAEPVVKLKKGIRLQVLFSNTVKDAPQRQSLGPDSHATSMVNDWSLRQFAFHRLAKRLNRVDSGVHSWLSCSRCGLKHRVCGWRLPAHASPSWRISRARDTWPRRAGPPGRPVRRPDLPCPRINPVNRWVSARTLATPSR